MRPKKKPTRRARAPRAPAPRRRRTAAAARELILDVAERRLAEVGPGGLRLQDIAAEVGVSHPTILHHFESREGLVEAVVRRGVGALNQDILESMRKFDPRAEGPDDLIERVFEVFGDRGHARLLAWLGLSGRAPTHQDTELRDIAEACHVVRRTIWAKEPPFEDTLFTMLLAGLVAIGDGVSGDLLRTSAGLGDDRDAKKRFRRWLARLLDAHLRSATAAEGT